VPVSGCVQFLAGADNISYFVGLSAEESKPQTILSGDGNILGGGGGLDPFWNEAAGSSIDAMWEQGASHGADGQILLSDGSVQQTTTQQLRDAISESLSGGSTNVMFSLPRGVE